MTQDIPELTIDELTKALANLTTELIATNSIAIEAHNYTQATTQVLLNMQERFKAISREVAEQAEAIERLDAAYTVIQSYIQKGSK